MDNKDYLELKQLVRGAEVALLSGTLSDWQHANTSTFHVLANAIVDLNDRLSIVAQLLDASTLASNKPPKSRIVVEDGI